MMKVRKLLTEILLDVTSDEVLSVAKQVYRKAKLKAAKGITSLVMHHLKNPFLGGIWTLPTWLTCTRSTDFKHTSWFC